MTRRVVVAKLARQIGELEIEGTVYPINSPSGAVVQEMDARGDEFKATDGYDLVAKCVPTLERAVLMQLDPGYISQILDVIRDAIRGITEEVLSASPKAEPATTS